ncbi:MAG: endonuclease [Candidatus Wallbacteria bacterium]|nr:endonuclease [Candidatus Wallbacteria bacterium]
MFVSIKVKTIIAVILISISLNADPAAKTDPSLFFNDSYKLKLQTEISSQLELLVQSGKLTLSETVPLQEKLDQLVFFSLESSRAAIDSTPLAVTSDEFSECSGLKDEALKSKLNEITGRSYTSVSYTNARKIIFTTVDNTNSVVTDYYEGKQVIVTSTLPPDTVMNIEHVWPQSEGATGIAKSDMHHLLPTDSKANNVRANYPFGIVPDSQATWSVGGSKYANHIFEPRDSSKGDIARATFYFAIRYNKPVDDQEEKILKAWNEQDPPDDYEIQRDAKIAQYQKNRNPFVVHPEFVSRIADF